MEGLEINTVLLSDCIDLDYGYRFDAEFYKKEDIVLNNRIISCPHNKLADLTTKIDVGYVGSMVCEYTNEKTAPILLQTKNIAEFFVNAADMKRINPTFHNSLQKSLVRFENILIARSGSFGNASIYLEREVVNSADIIIVEADKNRINPYYLVAYLNSRLGRRQLYRFASGGLQGHINLTILEQLHVVLPSVRFQEKVEQTIQKAYSYTQLATKNYALCEQMLLFEIKLNHWTPDNDTVSYNRFSDFVNSGRLDAEYYQPKYDNLFSRLSKFETKRLGDIVQIHKSIEPGSDAYQNQGIPFMRVANLSKFGFSDADIHLSPDEYRDVIRPKQNTILLSKDGSVGIAYKVEQDMDVITSGAILHLTITDNEFMPDYLTLVLNSVIVGMQAERDVGGSIIQHWKPSEIENVIIPKLSQEIQQEITNKIRESFALRKESHRLLDFAKTMVETAIEQSEDAAMKLLNQ